MLSTIGISINYTDVIQEPLQKCRILTGHVRKDSVKTDTVGSRREREESMVSD